MTGARAHVSGLVGQGVYKSVTRRQINWGHASKVSETAKTAESKSDRMNHHQLEFNNVSFLSLLDAPGVSEYPTHGAKRRLILWFEGRFPSIVPATAEKDAY